MADRLLQPAPKPSPTGRGRPVDRAAGTRIPGFGADRFSQALGDEPVERAVGLGGTHAEDPPEFATGPKFLGQSEAVVGVLGEHPQHGVVGDRQSGADHRDRLVGGSPHIPGVGRYSKISIDAPSTMR